VAEAWIKDGEFLSREELSGSVTSRWKGRKHQYCGAAALYSGLSINVIIPIFPTMVPPFLIKTLRLLQLKGTLAFADDSLEKPVDGGKMGW
jgi:hypothetical protein